jgi:hypothetical protein
VKPAQTGSIGIIVVIVGIVVAVGYVCSSCFRIGILFAGCVAIITTGIAFHRRIFFGIIILIRFRLDILFLLRGSLGVAVGVIGNLT